MSKPFEWRDFSKRYNDLSTNNFPTLKDGKLQDSIKFKFSSKAQKGVKLDSSVTNTNNTSSDSEFSVKVNFEDLQGVELGLKAKSKPSTEFTLRFDDKLIPLEGASFTLKSVATAPSEQTVGGSFGFSNNLVNLNLAVNVPVSRRLFSFLKDDQDALSNQRTKVDLDFVARPLEDRDVYVGGEVKTQLPQKENELLYTSKVSVALNNKTTNGGVFLEHKKELVKVENEDKKVAQHSNSFGTWVYTEVDDLSGGARVSYTPSKSASPFEFELVAGLQRDQDSKLSSKVTVVPNTTVSLGYEQKLSSNTKLSFGYAFLLNKSTENSSSYSFGVEISH